MNTNAVHVLILTPLMTISCICSSESIVPVSEALEQYVLQHNGTFPSPTRVKMTSASRLGIHKKDKRKFPRIDLFEKKIVQEVPAKADEFIVE
jgi:hypothetical protein